MCITSKYTSGNVRQDLGEVIASSSLLATRLAILNEAKSVIALCFFNIFGRFDFGLYHIFYAKTALVFSKIEKILFFSIFA